MKRLLLLLFFIPLVSFGQSNNSAELVMNFINSVKSESDEISAELNPVLERFFENKHDAGIRKKTKEFFEGDFANRLKDFSVDLSKKTSNISNDARLKDNLHNKIELLLNLSIKRFKEFADSNIEKIEPVLNLIDLLELCIVYDMGEGEIMFSSSSPIPKNECIDRYNAIIMDYNSIIMKENSASFKYQIEFSKLSLYLPFISN